MAAVSMQFCNEAIAQNKIIPSLLLPQCASPHFARRVSHDALESKGIVVSWLYDMTNIMQDDTSYT
jgi:hypothetical protein